MILKPPGLKAGDTIALIAPAGPLSPPELQPCIDRLEALGFRILAGDSLFENHAYLAGTDQARLKDLIRAFRNRKVKAVLCARGGYGTLRLLSRIDFDLVRGNPKIFVGYSDITALLLALSGKTGLVTFHGPMGRDLLKNDGKNLEHLLTLITSGKNTAPALCGERVLRPGKARGRLVGGNLSLLCHLVGTPYMTRWRKCILFLEDTGEAPYRIDRMLTHLRLSGFMRNIAGLAAGQFDGCGETSGIDELLRDAVAGLNIPVVSGFPIGHGEQNLALPIGVPAVLDSKSLTLTVSGSCTR